MPFNKISDMLTNSDSSELSAIAPLAAILLAMPGYWSSDIRYRRTFDEPNRAIRIRHVAAMNIHGNHPLLTIIKNDFKRFTNITAFPLRRVIFGEYPMSRFDSSQDGKLLIGGSNRCVPCDSNNKPLFATCSGMLSFFPSSLANP